MPVDISKAPSVDHPVAYRNWMNKMAQKYPDEFVAAYRADPTSPTGVESLPTYYHKDTLQAYANAVGDAKQLGAKTLNSADLAALALKEGRHDYGFNEIDANNKHALNIANNLAQFFGHEDIPAEFAGAIHDKLQKADHYGVSFGEAWNGRGTNKYGQTGKDYAADLERAKQAIQNPLNQNFRDQIESGMHPGSEWNNANNTPVPDLKLKNGGVAMPQEYSTGSWKLI
jgi:hypothetical protein